MHRNRIFTRKGDVIFHNRQLIPARDLFDIRLKVLKATGFKLTPKDAMTLFTTGKVKAFHRTFVFGNIL